MTDRTASMTASILPSPGAAPERRLDPRAERLLASLPQAHRLPVLQRHYPHVVNRVAAEWSQPRRMLAAFDELLVDARGSRSGFRYEAARELMQLCEYYVGTLHPELRPEPTARDPDVWR